MRYSDRVTLHKVLGRAYDPSVGKTVVEVDEGVTLSCNTSPISLERVKVIFGSLDKQITTVRLQRPYKHEVDKAVINGNKYNVLRHVPYRSESVLFLEGVSEWT
ncbi:hypothetical protein AS034_05210 [[Bacillus] enclensis]|uniref:Phage head-tail adaptor n=2 Tax=Rossellomorea TaxID=2837508 RepID=A0A1J6W0E5_9BACI|nr:hypothetical protein AS034_05210 [[Bacillus] enclensis]OIU71050.1 hypothetical protein BHE18_08355 [Rossellomorea aquimaris]SCB87496.1 hypothetical protein GA0061094_1087 [[Bacillus] enclensis]